MLTGDIKINELISDGGIKVHKLNESRELNIGPNSIDVTLAPVIYAMTTGSIIDPEEPLKGDVFLKKVIPDCGMVLHPGDFILASAAERFEIDPSAGLVQHYDGRSTFARFGILSHVSAGFGDYGFEGAFTLEIKNLGKRGFIIRKGMRIGQVYFEEVSESTGYDGYDQTNFEPQLPRIGKGRF